MEDKTPFQKAINAASEALVRAEDMAGQDFDATMRIAAQWIEIARVITTGEYMTPIPFPLNVGVAS